MGSADFLGTAQRSAKGPLGSPTSFKKSEMTCTYEEIEGKTVMLCPPGYGMQGG